MKRIASVLSVAAIALVMSAGVFAQAHPSFAGKWAMDAPQGGGAAPGGPGGPGGGGRGGGRGGWGPQITITQDATTLTVEGMQGQNATKSVYKLDGSESKNTMMGRGGEPTDQVSKAAWSGSKLVITTTMANGEQKRTLSLEGADLVVEQEAPGRDGGPMTTKTVYKRS